MDESGGLPRGAHQSAAEENGIDPVWSKNSTDAETATANGVLDDLARHSRSMTGGWLGGRNPYGSSIVARSGALSKYGQDKFRDSGRLPVIVLEYAGQAFATSDRAGVLANLGARLQEFVVHPLMRASGVNMAYGQKSEPKQKSRWRAGIRAGLHDNLDR
jgi:hypothetical protein